MKKQRDFSSISITAFPKVSEGEVEKLEKYITKIEYITNLTYLVNFAFEREKC